jgi:putative heme degradation protein
MPSDFSREASDYEATNHLLEQLKYERQYLTTEMCAEAIEQGDVIGSEVSDRGNLCVELRHEWGAMTYVVVIDVDDRKVVTATDKGHSNND